MFQRHISEPERTVDGVHFMTGKDAWNQEDVFAWSGPTDLFGSGNFDIPAGSRIAAIGLGYGENERIYLIQPETKE